MRPHGLARVDQLGFGDDAVGYDREVVVGREKMRRAPVRLDHASLCAPVEYDPVAGMIGFREIEHDAREDVAERALKGEAEHDGDDAGGRQQAADRHVEDISDDREASGGVDDADEEILQEPGLARLSSEHEQCTEETRKQPGGRDPPDDLEGADHEIREVGANFRRRLRRQNPGRQQHGGEAAERGELAEEASDRVFAKSEPRHEKADDKKDAGERQRDRGLRDIADQLSGHAQLISPPRTANMRRERPIEASRRPVASGQQPICSENSLRLPRSSG